MSKTLGEFEQAILFALLELKEDDATIPNESGNGLSNRRLTIAMARTGEPHTADSQFYINLADNVALDPKPTRWGYAVFGEVVGRADPGAHQQERGPQGSARDDDFVGIEVLVG